MTSYEILKADILDILFDNRNKQYGAYALRKHYAGRMGWALGITLSSVLLLLLLLKPGTDRQNGTWINEKPDVVTTVIIPPTQVLPPALPLPPAAPRVKSFSLTENFRLVDQPDPAKSIEPIARMQDGAIGNANTEGPLNPAAQAAPPAEAPKATAGTAGTEEVFVPVEKAPQFPGGSAAWAAFLNRNLRTPQDLQPGEKIMVLISFQVDVEGNITGFRVVQSGGGAFDNEVIRVLRKMPRWTPALQNGHPIAVSFTQPVTFVGTED